MHACRPEYIASCIHTCLHAHMHTLHTCIHAYTCMHTCMHAMHTGIHKCMHAYIICWSRSKGIRRFRRKMSGSILLQHPKQICSRASGFLCYHMIKVTSSVFFFQKITFRFLSANLLGNIPYRSFYYFLDLEIM